MHGYVNFFVQIRQGLKKPGIIEKACMQVKCSFFTEVFQSKKIFETGFFTANFPV
jgi:hypothetical protein